MMLSYLQVSSSHRYPSPHGFVMVIDRTTVAFFGGMSESNTRNVILNELPMSALKSTGQPNSPFLTNSWPWQPLARQSEGGQASTCVHATKLNLLNIEGIKADQGIGSCLPAEPLIMIYILVEKTKGILLCTAGVLPICHKYRQKPAHLLRCGT